MKLWLAIGFLHILGCNASASRFIIPDDKDVMIEFPSEQTREYLNPSQINLLVWNIYKGDMAAFKKEYAKFIQGQDLLLIQEAFLTQDYLAQLKAHPQFESYFATSWIDGKNQMTPTGVLTASRARAIESSWQRSFYREPFVNTPKMVLFTKYLLEGSDTTLLVGNIHGINFVSTKKFEHMLKEATRLLAGHAGPIVFAGDFNTHLKARGRLMRTLLTELGLQQLAFQPDQRVKFLGSYIDHIWIRGLEAIQSSAPACKGSDHNPMFVQLKLL